MLFKGTRSRPIHGNLSPATRRSAVEGQRVCLLMGHREDAVRAVLKYCSILSTISACWLATLCFSARSDRKSYSSNGSPQAERTAFQSPIRTAWGEPLELYDLRSDLAEKHNVA